MAAHLKLPFGTVLRVTNLQNGRDVLVRINDRGPFSRRLGLDISQAAARELNMVRAGVSRVQTEIVSDANGRPILPGTGFYVDLGTVSKPDSTREKAEIESLEGVRRKAGLEKGPSIQAFTKKISENRGRRFVGMGPYKNFAEAEKAYKSLKKHWPRARVICAAMTDAKPRLVASVVADDIPKVVMEYKGKQKASSSSKVSKAKKRSDAQSGTVSKNKKSSRKPAVSSSKSQKNKKSTASKKRVSNKKSATTRSAKSKTKNTAPTKSSTKATDAGSVRASTSTATR